MLEVWHIAVKLVNEDDPHIVRVTSNTLKGAMSVAPHGLAYRLEKNINEMNIEGLVLVGIGK